MSDVHAERAAIAQHSSDTPVRTVPIESLQTTYAPLRPGRLPLSPDQPTPLPLRVVPTDGGGYEVIDGFKRLAVLHDEGVREVAVVVEPAVRAQEHKRLILQANNPAKTLTAMDEARVVQSLVKVDGLTIRAAAKLLHRKPVWVERRLAFASKLTGEAQQALAEGRIGPSIAQALTELQFDQQKRVLECAREKDLRPNELLRLVQAYRIADASDRRVLLQDPLGTGRPDPEPSLSRYVVQLEERLNHINRAIEDLTNFVVPDVLSPPEQRRLEAAYCTAVHHLLEAAKALGPATVEAATSTERPEEKEASNEPPPSAVHVDGTPSPLDHEPARDAPARRSLVRTDDDLQNIDEGLFAEHPQQTRLPFDGYV
jgi:ParB-like chromosome segregation protein Spo0J